MALERNQIEAIAYFNEQLSVVGERLLKHHVYGIDPSFRDEYNKTTIEPVGNYIDKDIDVMDPKTLLNIINGVIWPAINEKDSSLVDHPIDPRLTSMRGITVSDLFDGANLDRMNIKALTKVFTDESDVTKDFKLMRLAINNLDKAFKSAQASSAKEALHLMFTQEIAAKLWFVKMCGLNPTFGLPLNIMAKLNVYLGYFLMLSCWLQGNLALTLVKGKDDSTTLYNVMRNSFSTFPTLPSEFTFTDSPNSPDVASVTASIQLIQTFYEWLQKQKENTNKEYYQGWFDRFFSDKRSTINMLIIINEKVNVNAAGEFKYSPKLAKRLATMGGAYVQKFNIKIGD